MEITAAVLLFLAGLLEGFLAGVFDAGGGIVLVPVLLYYLHSAGVSSLVSTHVAMGTSLLVVACSAAFRTREDSRANHVIWRGSFSMAGGGILGASLGVLIAAGLEGPSLRAIFGCLLLVAAVRLFSGKRKQGKELEPLLALPPLAGIGGAIGIICALTGTGGTVISVPLLSAYRHFPLRKAIGTAGASAVITAAAGAAVYFVRGLGNEFLPAEISGGMIGARMGTKADVSSVRYSLGVLLLVVMLRMFFP